MLRAEQLSAGKRQPLATCDEMQLSERVTVYREIHLEVHLEALHPEDEKGRVGCLAAFPYLCHTIDTRKREGAS